MKVLINIINEKTNIKMLYAPSFPLHSENSDVQLR